MSETAAPARPGRKPSSEKRAAILRAALVLIAERGADAATTREIAAAAGTTERTLFKHFGSKAALVQSVIAEAALDLMRQAAFARVHDSRPFTRDELAAWHRAFLEERVAAAERAPDGYRVLMVELLRDPAFRERFAEVWLSGVFHPFAEHLARLQQSGAIAGSQTPQALAAAFFSLNLGYLITRFALSPARGWTTASDIDGIVGLFAAACSPDTTGATPA